MVTISTMRMVVYPAKPEVQNMCRYYQYYGRDEQYYFGTMPQLLGYKQHKPYNKHQRRPYTMMVLFVAVIKRAGTYCKRQYNHTHFKPMIMNDIYTK